jgi:aminoglycoside phosphotransferase (APT) family kinase protein
VVAHGDRLGADYLIVTRRPGRPLSRCWPTMDRSQRHRAIRQFTSCLVDLHQTRNDGALVDIGPTPHLLDDTEPVAPLLEALDRLSTRKGAEHQLVAEARQTTVSLAGALDRGPHQTLVHGDLTLENILWDGRQITAVLDFEWCRPGPADLDLDVLGRFFSIPGAHLPIEAAAAQAAEDYRQVPGWMAQVYPALFDHPRLGERLFIYALAFEVRDVLASPLPTDKSGLHPLHPYLRLDHLVATGGHVNELLEHLGLPAL